MNVDLKCRVCNEECPNIRSLIGHVRARHGMESKEYYDIYYKQETDGICETCGGPTKFYRISQGGYFRFCSKKCSNKSPFTQARKVETNLEKYGTRTSSQNAAVKEKAKQTCIEKYGTTSSAQSETVKETVRRNLRKTEACDAKGVRLVHIFEDEWTYRQDIVKSVISGMFGLNEKIYARKCEIREVSPECATAFLEKNHL